MKEINPTITGSGFWSHKNELEQAPIRVIDPKTGDTKQLSPEEFVSAHDREPIDPASNVSKHFVTCDGIFWAG